MNATSEKILNSYLKNLKLLNPVQKRHFLYRAYLINKNKNLGFLLNEHGKKYSLSQITFIDQFNNNFNQGVGEEIKFIKTQKNFYPHDESKYLVWSKYPELIYFYTILRESFYLKYFQIPFQLNLDLVKKLLILATNSQEFIKKSSAYATCTFFYLKYLGYLSLVKDKNIFDYSKIIISNFVINKNSNLTEIFNYLYLINHLIIGNTFFYLKKPDSYFFQFLEDLKNKLYEYYDKLSLDLKAESLLVFCLCNRFDNHLYNKIINELLRNFDQQMGIIDNKKSDVLTFTSAEHTNSLFLLTTNYKNLLKRMNSLVFDYK